MDAMTAYLLNFLYLLVVILAAPWFLFQRLFRGKYREGFAAKFLGTVPERKSSAPCIWLHAVSVGEVNLLAVLLAEVGKRRPEVECVISTTSMTGYELARKKYAKHTVFYCPLDFSWAVCRAMRRIRPSLLILAELELWPNLIRAAKESGAAVAIVNGRLSERSFRGYRCIRRLLGATLDRLDLVATQNEEYADRFRALGTDLAKVHITGNLKFDGAQTDRENPRTNALRQLAAFSDHDIIFLAGSTQEPEERLALETFEALSASHPRLRLILVPRHPHRFDEVASLLDRSGLSWQRRSQLQPPALPGVHASGLTPDLRPSTSDPSSHFPLPTAHRPPVLLVDTIGELSAWWGAATIGFVGGSLYSTRGGQNMIEPAAYGIATCFGPNTQNFRDVVELLLTAEAANRVTSGEELTAFVRRCLEDPAFAPNLGHRATSLVCQQQGATGRTWSLIEELLPSRAHGSAVVSERAA
jgi:3-deoxy-D-manno-octulosonic-acid transferase